MSPSSLFWMRTWALTGMLALAGCSTPAPPQVMPGFEQTVWSGRLGLQVHDPMSAEQSFSASFQLQGSAAQGSLDIFNPLGSQIAKLQWQPGAAWLQQGERITPSTSLDDLLRQSLGTALPVEALFGWLQGQPASAPGWNADLSRYAQGRITAQRVAPPPQATLRVVLQPSE